MNKHKHATAAIAWANGSELEYKNSYGVWWAYTPDAFSEVLDIRVKPVPSIISEIHKAKLERINKLRIEIDNLSRNL